MGDVHLTPRVWSRSAIFAERGTELAPRELGDGLRRRLTGIMIGDSSPFEGEQDYYTYFYNCIMPRPIEESEPLKYSSLLYKPSFQTPLLCIKDVITSLFMHSCVDLVR